jgi:hypothetical protein
MILHRTPMAAYHPTAPILAEDERALWGMKSGSRLQDRTAVVGFESGPWLLMIGDVGF